MSGHIGQLEGMFDCRGLGIENCDSQEDATIYHYRDLGSSIDACMQGENCFRFNIIDFLKVM